MEAAQNWHIQHEISDNRLMIVCIWYNELSSSQGDATKIKSKHEI